MAWTLAASIFVLPEPAPWAVAGGGGLPVDRAVFFPPWPRLSLPEAAMPQFQTWEEFSRAAEKLYLADPMKVRVVLKYRHVDGNLCIKVTDDLVCLVYRTDQAQDVKKIEKFHSQLMRLMVAKESRSVSMETE